MSWPVVLSTLEGLWASQRPKADVSASPRNPVSCTGPQLYHSLLQAVAHGGFPGPLSEEGPERLNLLAHRPRVHPQPASLPTGDSLGGSSSP